MTPRIRSGAYSNANQVIGRALEVLSAEDEWLQAHRGTIDEKIGRGLKQLDCGEGIPGSSPAPRYRNAKRLFLHKNRAIIHERISSFAGSR